MKKLNVLFRTAGGTAKGKELGFGHIFRCINLANSFRINQIHFLLEDFGSASLLLKKKRYSKVHQLKPNIDLKSDISESMKYLNDKKIDVLIIDRYNVSKMYVSYMKKYVKTVVITDLKKIDYDADLLVNGFIGFENEIRDNKYRTRCLLGPKYQILNKKFSKKNFKKKKKNYLLATFGGYDEKRISLILLKIISEIDSKIKIKIILGTGIKMKESEKKKFLDKSIEIINNTNNMYDEIQNAEYGLCSGGLTTYEFAASNIPFGIICQNNHQLITAKEWDNKKLALNLGLVEKLDRKKIEKFLHSVRKISKKYKKLVSGEGSKIVSDEIIRLMDRRIS